MNRVLRAWGANPPDWVKVLAERCDKSTSQAAVGVELEISSAAVNQVLGNVYKGRLDRIEAKVRGRYMAAVVQCPVLGEISTNDCLRNQKAAAKFKATNPLRVKLFAACKACPNRERAKEEACATS